MGEHRAFDPSDPFDAMADRLRREVVQLAIDAERTAIYRDLPPHSKLECFIAGTMSGVIGTVFASIEAEGRDYMMEYIAQALPAARYYAESVRPSPEAGQ